MNQDTQPPALYPLCVAEMLSRFGFSGLISIFVLYMVQQLQYPRGEAFGILGAFLATVYVMPLIGGWIADRYLRPRLCVVVGTLLSGCGMLALAFWGHRLWFDYGLATMIWGYALILPNLIKLVGACYDDEDSRRDSGFTIYHMASMFGAILGPLVCGWIGKSMGAHAGFGAAAIGMFLGLPAFLLSRRWMRLEQFTLKYVATPRAILLSVATSVVAILGIGLLVMHNQDTRWLIGGLTLSCMVYMLILGRACNRQERRHIRLIVILMIFYIVFESYIRQADGLLTLFAQHAVQRKVFGMTIPAPSFQSLESFWVAVLSPVFVWVWVRLGQKRPNWNTAHKFVVGLVLMGASFGVLGLAGHMHAVHGQISWFWLLLCYAFQALSELCMLPIGLAMVTQLAPRRFSGVFVGLWVVTAGIGGFIGTQIGRWAQAHIPPEASHQPGLALQHYTQVFQSMALWPVLAACLLWAVAPYIRKLCDQRF